MIKKKMSLLLAAVLVASGVGMVKPAFAVDAKAKALPVVTYAAPEHTIATDDAPFTFAVQSAKYEGDVQYRIFVQKDGGKWFELTDGYSEAVSGKNPYIPKVTKNLEAGHYKASIWVKRAEVEEGVDKNVFGSCDTYCVKTFSIGTAESLKNRANLNDLGIKDTYKVGEKLTISGKEGYQYKLHMYDPSVPVRREGWYIDNTYEAAATTDYTFTKPGTYLVDVWGLTPNPSEAVKRQGYDAWKLKVVTVEEGNKEVKSTVEVSEGVTPFDRYVKVTLDVADPANYEVTVAGQKLDFAEGKNFFDGIVNQTDEAKIKESVKVVKIGEPVEVPTAKVEKVEAGVTPFDRYVTVTLDTETPEKFEVTVDGQKLEFAEGKNYFDGIVNGTDEAKIKAGVKVTVK